MIGIRYYAALGFLSPLLVIAGCSGGSVEAPSSSSTDDPAMFATARMALSTENASAHKDWHRAMSKKSSPKDGCFRATYPSVTWEEIPCGEAPDYPLAIAQHGGAAAATRGGGTADVGGSSSDLVATMPGPLAWAEGSFPSVSGVTSVSSVDSTGNATAGAYSIQLNTNDFTTSMCNGGLSGCQGVQQFVYDSPGSGFMEYVLVGYGNCPTGWRSNNGNCYKASKSVSIPTQPITNLANISVLASTGTSDMLTVAVGNTVYMVSQASVLGLNGGQWQTSEFNVFGDHDSHQAVFNPGSTIVVQLLTDQVSPSTTQPNVTFGGVTSESNNLNVSSTAYCAFDGNPPGLQFEESNAASPPAVACPIEPLGINWSVVGHPFDAPPTGTDTNGSPLYSCRANYQGSLQVGKTRADWQSCVIGYGGQEVFVKPYESLVPGWVDETGGAVPPNALALGTDGSGGPPLYSCRTFLNGNGYQLGKVRPDLGGCYVPYGGSEILANPYQVLTADLPLTGKSITGAPPSNALIGGYDSDASPLYLCVASYGGGLVPGKTRVGFNSCDVSWGGSEHFISNYYVYTPQFITPGTIFRAGSDGTGTLGICRAPYLGSTQVGKYMSWGACNFSFSGSEISLTSGYTVLALY